MKKTFVLAASVPSTGVVGEILLREALSCPGVDRVSLASIVAPAANDRCQTEYLSHHRTFAAPKEHAQRSSPGLRGSLSALWHRSRTYDSEISTIAQGVREFLKTERPEQVWVIASSMAVIDVAFAVLDEIPELLVQVWDDPVHLMTERRLDRLTRKRTLDRFHRLLQRSVRTGVICEEMADAYQPYSAGPCVVIRHGLTDAAAPQWTPSSDREFRIGFSGGMYCHSAWRALQAGLDGLNWKVSGRDVSLRVAGARVQFDSRSPANGVFLGWRSEEEVAELLTGCDLLYLPQPFESQGKSLAQLSFPTKLSSYVSTGRPVFIHAPEYGSLTRFSKDQDFGLLCNSTRPQDVSSCLKRIEEEPDLIERLARSSARIARDVLSRKNFESAVRQFLGAEPVALEGRKPSPAEALQTSVAG